METTRAGAITAQTITRSLYQSYPPLAAKMVESWYRPYPSSTAKMVESSSRPYPPPTAKKMVESSSRRSMAHQRHPRPPSQAVETGTKAGGPTILLAHTVLGLRMVIIAAMMMVVVDGYELYVFQISSCLANQYVNVICFNALTINILFGERAMKYPFSR